MKIIYILLVGITTFISLPVQAQVTISGRVLDAETNLPLPGSMIATSDSSGFAFSDEQGFFKVNCRSNETIVTVISFGYHTKNVVMTEGLTVLLKPQSYLLDQVVIQGHNSNRKYIETPGSVGVIVKEDLERTSQVSLQPVLNLIPGVRMDQSNLGDARISIRGIGVRSNFGIRNIRIYLNEIPLTEANGFTRIEGFDPTTLGQMEIIKGPSSSIFGSGLGGVINISSEKADSETSAELKSVSGSYGLFRNNLTYRSSAGKSSYILNYGKQSYQGYREHSADKRDFVSALGRFIPDEKTIVTVFLNHSRQDTELPGAIDLNTFRNSPRAANEQEILKDAGRKQEWTRMGVTYDKEINNRLSFIGSAYSSFHQLDHPLAFAYIRGQYQSYGSRGRLELKDSIGSMKFKATAGGEFLHGINAGKYYVNMNGQEGAPTQDKIVRALQYTVFAHGELELDKKTLISAGLSLNSMQYAISDLLKTNGTDFSGKKSFDPVVAPRIAFFRKIYKNTAVYGSASYGFSPPTDNEISNPDGSVNFNVQAEKGICYELGTKGTLRKSSLLYDFTLFSMFIKDELIPQTIGNYQVVYINAGKTEHHGLEALLQYKYEKKTGFFREIRPFLSGSLNHFLFTEYMVNGEDYSGNNLTGIPKVTLNMGFDLKLIRNFYLNTTCLSTGKYYITDDNENSVPGYSLLNMRTGWKSRIRPRIPVDIFAGVDNITNEKYSAFINLNARSNTPGSGPRFYNPSPGRNWYAGISLKYLLKL